MSVELLERVVLENFPVTTMPQTGHLVRPKSLGQRYVVAREGLFREVSTPWLYALLPLASIRGMQAPYGPCLPTVELTMNQPPAHLWRMFREMAEQALPHECAGAFIWNTVTAEWRLAVREAQNASPHHVDFAEAPVGEDEVLVVDIHSHASHKAFFSSTDDRDDAGGLKIAAVLGQVDTESPTLCLRLVCLDRFLPMRLDQSGALDVHIEVVA
jgi:PRTRC genetic system protein A